jgi:cytochrome c553
MRSSFRNARPLHFARAGDGIRMRDNAACLRGRRMRIKLSLLRSSGAAQLFTRTCALCHGADARGTDRAPSLVNSDQLRGMPDSDIADIIRKGKNKMPAFPFPAATA